MLFAATNKSIIIIVRLFAQMLRQEICKPDTFLYFAYGANLLRFRMKWINPSGEFVSIARLDNYRLDFIRFNSFWGGPTATIVPTANAHTWGVIWRLSNEEKQSLDDQNLVYKKIYFVKKVRVFTPHVGQHVCRTYMKRVYPLPRGDRDPIPVERWPSFSYKQVLILGAEQNGLPQYYIKFLKKLKDNGDVGGWLWALMLRRYERELPCECIVPGKIPREPLKKWVSQISSHRSEEKKKNK